jgi:hypothetical protein
LDFLSHDGRFFQAWAASNKLNIQILAFAHVTKLRNMRDGSVRTRCTKHRKAENSPKTQVIFFCPKIDEFCMVLCRVTLDGQLWPSICSSTRLGFP